MLPGQSSVTYTIQRYPPTVSVMQTQLLSTNIKRLSSPENYRAWKIHLQNALEARGLWTIVTGQKVEPTTETHPSDLEDRLELFFQNRAQARSLILEACDEKLVVILEGIRDLKLIWESLETKCQPLGAVKEYPTFIQLITTGFHGKNLKSFCEEFEATSLRAYALTLHPRNYWSPSISFTWPHRTLNLSVVHSETSSAMQPTERIFH